MGCKHKDVVHAHERNLLLQLKIDKIGTCTAVHNNHDGRLCALQFKITWASDSDDSALVQWESDEKQFHFLTKNAKAGAIEDIDFGTVNKGPFQINLINNVSPTEQPSRGLDTHKEIQQRTRNNEHS
jgi:hypothetical protein